MKKESNMFTLRNVSYKNILNVENLSIPEGVTFCVLGESGSGKTTFLKLLNNLISPDEGEILFREEKISELETVELRRRVVMLPQVPVIFPGSIRENLLLGLNFAQKVGVADEELYSLLERMNLAKELGEDAATLSGGEKQRLAIARVLLMKPDVVLLDEPTSALDENTEERAIEEVMERSRKNNTTVVIVTHNPRLATRYGEMVVDLHEGKAGAVREVCGENERYCRN